MEIYYDQRIDGARNFGDDLNLWLWPQLIPELLAHPKGDVFVGIGTLINAKLLERVKQAKNVLILSAGVGYEQPLTAIPNHWQIYCLRGPHSCRALGLPSTLAITDGAVLLRRVVQPRPIASRHQAAFMPHIHHAVFAGALWQQICAASGIRYIDPRWPVEQVLTEIQSSQRLISEAMHGAIAADALGIPWIPVVSSPRILSFKWQDWCASIQQPYQPIYLPPVSGYPRYARGIRSSWVVARHWQKTWFQRVGQPAVTGHPDKLATILNRIVDQVQPRLSDRTHLETLTQALEAKLETLRQDLSDTFSP